MAVFQIRNLATVSAFTRNFRLIRQVIQFPQYLCAKGYAIKKPAGGGKMGPMVEKKDLPVETDAKVLANFVCGSNIYKQGEDVRIKDDAEYPDWLWTLRLGKPPDLEDLDPNTLEYWRRYRKLARRREFALKKGKKF